MLVRVVEVVVKVLVAMVERRGLPQGAFFSGHSFFAAPSPLSLLLFRFVVVSISSTGLAFFFFLGDGAAGVLGVAGFFWLDGVFFGVVADDCLIAVAAAAGVSFVVVTAGVSFVDVASVGVSVVTAAADGSIVVVATAAVCVGALVCF